MTQTNASGGYKCVQTLDALVYVDLKMNENPTILPPSWYRRHGRDVQTRRLGDV